jgi:hypothetical protein
MFRNQNARPTKRSVPAQLVWVERCLIAGPGEKHLSTQTSCEGTKRDIGSASGIETSDHGASSCGAVAPGPTLTCPGGKMFRNRNHRYSYDSSSLRSPG